MSSVHGSVHGQSVCANGQARTSCVPRGPKSPEQSTGRASMLICVLTDDHGRPVCTNGRPRTDVLCVLTDTRTHTDSHGRPACADGRPLWADGRPVCTDGRPACADGHTDSHGRPACADGRPACADGRPVCADGRPVCTDGHTDTHGQPRTSCVPREPKSPEQSTERADMCTDGQPDVLCVLTDGHVRPVCADGHTRTSVCTEQTAHVGQNHPRTAKITREAKNAKINIF
ncbi:hypothetical protein IGI04_019442 [Brassica rapa subsp. trilocularis]|uniref:Uncharacterized protein n=1 Tax=Brassica rapa subsp. trilocularis TaxID=1813537 RepID=A0ABQ7MFV3_BRACM|nr:hypothetical protein IGI04_019442 [Brassica rapa subsp. trilocularis]